MSMINVMVIDDNKNEVYTISNKAEIEMIHCTNFKNQIKSFLR